MAKKTPSNRPTTSRSVNRTTPSNTRVTVDVESVNESQIPCEDISSSDDMSPLHSRGRSTPSSPSVADLEDDSKSYKKREDFRSSIRNFTRLAETYASYINRAIMIKQLEERISEMKEKYAVTFNVPLSEVEKRIAMDSDEDGDSDEKGSDLNDENSEGEDQYAAQATRSVQKAEAVSAAQKPLAMHEYVRVPLPRPVAAALSRDPADLHFGDVSQHPSQERCKAESTGDDVKGSIISSLKKSFILEDTLKPLKKSPSATAKSPNSKDALVADSAPSDCLSALAKHDETLFTYLVKTLFECCMDHPTHFTAEDALNVMRMCGGDVSVALRLYQQATDDPQKLKQALGEWMSSQQDIDDRGATKHRDEANGTGFKQEYCESEASDDTIHSESAHLEKNYCAPAAAWAANAWRYKTAPQHDEDCLGPWCNGHCVEELAHEADSTTAYPNTAQRSKELYDTAYDGLVNLAEDESPIQHADTCLGAWCGGECLGRLASTDVRDIHQDDPDPKTGSAPDRQSVPDDTASVFADRLPEPTSYSVTYWATIEHRGQTVHIPIDSSNVSGREKSIIEGAAGMNKVWKWVQEKGLTDKVSLRDAFDLAKDMQVEARAVVDKTYQSESGGDDDSKYVPPSSSSTGSSSSRASSFKDPWIKAWGKVSAPRDWATSKTIFGYAK